MFYSQHGEDFILDVIFNKNDGFYVEVGCIDGLRYSNTYYFEKSGWSGINIEANQDYIPKLMSNRNKSIVVHAAVGDSDVEKVPFYNNRNGLLSTLDASLEQVWKREYPENFYGFEKTEVSMKKLTSIFDNYNVKDIDILSLDIEGSEMDALNGLDFTKYQPKVIIIEFSSTFDLIKLYLKMNKIGYRLEYILQNNLFFTKDKDLFKQVKGKLFNDVDINHHHNTVLGGEDKIFKTTIDTRRREFYRRIGSRIKYDICKLILK